MKFFMNFPQSLIREVGVDLGGGDGGVAEHFLDGSDVGAVDEEFGGEGVAKHVWRDFFDDACATRVGAYEIFDGDGGESALFCQSNIISDNSFSAAVIRKYGLEVVGALAQVGRDTIGGLLRKKNNTWLSALTSHHKLASFEIDLCAIQRGKFGDAEAGGVERFQNSNVTKATDVAWIGLFKDAFELFTREILDGSFRNFRELDFFCGEGDDVVFCQVFEKCTQGDNVIVLRFYGEEFIALLLSLLFIGESIQIESILLNHIERNICHVDIARPLLKALEVVMVILQRTR